MNNKFRLLVWLFLSLSVGAFADNSETVLSLQTGTLPRTTRVGNRYYVNDTLMRRAAYQEYLRQTCTPAYNYFRSGRMMSQSGWSITGFGGAMVVTSVPFLLTTISYMSTIAQSYIGLPVPTPVQSVIFFRVGLISILSGAVCVAGGVTLIVLGNERQHDAANIYNAKAFGDCPTYWTISANTASVGVAYHF